MGYGHPDHEGGGTRNYQYNESHICLWHRGRAAVRAVQFANYH